MTPMRSLMRSTALYTISLSIVLCGSASAENLGPRIEAQPLAFPAQFGQQDTRETETFAPSSAAAGQNAPRPEGGDFPWLLVGGVAVGVAAAIGLGGGGGGGGGGEKEPTDPPLIDDTPPPDRGLDPRDFETAEYRRDYTLEMIGASARYADGGTGWGTLLSVFDTGADVDHVDLAPNVAYSWSYFTQSDDVTDHDDHGTHVASKVAGAKNEFGMHGVAYDAKLAIFQGVGWEGAPALEGGVLNAWADAQRRSVALGARAINHSWVFLDDQENERLITEFDRSSLARYLGSNVLDALRESADAGMLTVVAAGNDGQSDVSVVAGIPVLYPELGEHMLAVGAVGSNGRIANFSNRCGIAAEYCLVAPGVSTYGALSSDAGHAENVFGYMSGTSMAAPIVEGSIGVLASNFPELTGAEISRILRDTATDLGDPGVDEIYGNGLINLENAIAPQGTLMVLEGNDIGSGHTSLAESWIAGDSVIGTALSASLSGAQMMVADHYMRGYRLDMGKAVAIARDNVSAARVGLDTFSAAATAPIQAGSRRVGLAVSQSGIDTDDGAVWADARAFGSPYAGLADARHLVFAGPAAGGTLKLKSAIGEGDDSYAAAEFEADLPGGHGLSFEIGQLSEAGAMLGTEITGAFGSDLDSRTTFARIGGEARLGATTALAVSASVGRTSFDSTGILASGEDIASSSVGLGLRTASLLSAADRFSLGVSRPLSIDGGRLTLDAPVSMAASMKGERSSAVYRDRTEVELSSSRPVADIQIGYSAPAFGGRLGLGGVWRPQNGNSGLALTGGFALAF